MIQLPSILAEDQPRITKLVNKFPVYTAPYRLAIIGEFPSEADILNQSHFVNTAGRCLWGCISKHGVLKDACFLGNICQTQVVKDETEYKRYRFRSSADVAEGITQLEHDLTQFQPHCCLLLGQWPLTAFRLLEKSPLDDWRGSILQGRLSHTGPTFKYIATYHPSTVLKMYGACMPFFQHDLKRVSAEARTPTYETPYRNLETRLSPEAILDRLDKIYQTKTPISVDIEGYVFAMSCISIADSSSRSFIIPFSTSFWGDLEVEMWRRLARVLSDPATPKILQNCLYDMFVLQFSYNIPVRGVVDDTMLKHWELYNELPKALGVQASLYTREPYWKHNRGAEDPDVAYRYCCTDSAVTYEINTVLSKQLPPNSNTHYRFNMSMLEPLLYMELRGMAYNKPASIARHKLITHQSHLLQRVFLEVAGFTPPTREEWFRVCVESFCFKREQSRISSPAQIKQYCKKNFLEDSEAVVSILSQPQLSYADEGHLSLLTSYPLNVSSPSQLSDFLYRTLNLPVQFKKEHGQLTDDETSNALALLALYKKTGHPILKLILALRYCLTRTKSLGDKCDPDGRIRCGYNVVGSETGRLSCYTSPTGSGFNLQTVTKKDRDLLCADPGCWFFQCDLSGADGWTVAAHCAHQGDRTMLDDYQAGLKPAKLLALLYLHGAKVLTASRSDLRGLCKTIDSDGWLYFACKRVQHGSNYGMGAQTMSDTILKDSYKFLGEPILVEPSTCKHLQYYYLLRYPGVARWHNNYLKQLLITKGTLTSASGSTRIFFDRKDSHETFKQACAQEPQHNTTYVLNRAILQLWNDPENRTTISHGETSRVRMAAFLSTFNIRVSGAGGQQDTSKPTEEDQLASLPTGSHLIIEPLHQVHDAVNGQFPKDRTSWAVPRIKKYFDQPITIAGITLTIPFEGGYGPSWGQLKEGVI